MGRIMKYAVVMIVIIIALVFYGRWTNQLDQKRLENTEEYYKSGEYQKDLAEKQAFLTGEYNNAAYFHLVNAAYESEEEPGWTFLVNGQKIKPGYYKIDGQKIIITVINSLDQVIDQKDITKYVSNGYIIICEYNGPISSEGESLYIYIKHPDYSWKKIKINIEEQIPLKKSIIDFQNPLKEL